MLPAHQDAITATGHAVEARLYAEDPDSGFLPSTGTLTRVRFPGTARFERGSPRIDSGVETGSAISVFYDPMIAKVIAYGPDRASAIDGLVAALDGCVVDGVRTNRAFLARLVAHPAFRAGEIDTGFLGRHEADLRPPEGVSDDAVIVAALALAPVMPAAPTLFERLGDWRLNLPARRYIDLWRPDGSRIALTITGDTVEGLGEPLTATGHFTDDVAFAADLAGRRVEAIVVRDEDAVEIRIAGVAAHLSLPRPADRHPPSPAATGGSPRRCPVASSLSTLPSV